MFAVYNNMKTIEGLYGRGPKGQQELKKLCIDASLSGIMVEIGSYIGESTEIFAGFCKTVYAIDPWSDSWKVAESKENIEMISKIAPAYFATPMTIIEQMFDERMVKCPNIKKIKDFSDNAIINFKDGELDAIYIDSIHTYESTKRDINLWMPKVKLNGLIAGHDYFAPKWAGVVQAVNEAFGKPHKVYKDHSWVVYLNEMSVCQLD
jgi:hypothetical protein